MVSDFLGSARKNSLLKYDDIKRNLQNSTSTNSLASMKGWKFSFVRTYTPSSSFGSSAFNPVDRIVNSRQTNTFILGFSVKFALNTEYTTQARPTLCDLLSEMSTSDLFPTWLGDFNDVGFRSLCYTYSCIFPFSRPHIVGHHLVFRDT